MKLTFKILTFGANESHGLLTMCSDSSCCINWKVICCQFCCSAGPQGGPSVPQHHSASVWHSRSLGPLTEYSVRGWETKFGDCEVPLILFVRLRFGRGRAELTVPVATNWWAAEPIKMKKSPSPGLMSQVGCNSLLWKHLLGITLIIRTLKPCSVYSCL